MKFLVLLIIAIVATCNGGVLNMNQRSLDSVKSDWGYVTVREDAHMFWWLFFQDPTYQPSFLSPLDPIPVLIWLQGGPGASGTGYGNFEELGPLDLDLNRRETSWTGMGHVLFIDNPVGSGYSYVTNSNAYTTNIDEIAADMVALLKGFYGKHPELKTNPLYIMCESYGGKMAAASALAISQEIEAGTMDVNLQGVGLGDAWISPMDSVNTWGEYLYETGLLDDPGLAAVNQAAQATQNAVNNGDWSRATNLWSLTESVIINHADNVDFYNILSPHHPNLASRRNTRNLTGLVPEELIQGYSQNVNNYAADPLDALMNGEVKTYLGIPESVTWGGQSNAVFNAQAGDFMKPVIDTVDKLIATGMKVVVYNGHLDLIVDTPGQELWLKKMNWQQLSNFMSMDWTPEYAYKGKDTGGFSKKIDNFEFWWVLKAGHMVPMDAGEFTLHMLNDIITA
uniref:Retinoid-inducible serine carboxypeptidase n=1 Tax=Phallusia mammillata TaxID=59560 RepID=A0A6F9DR35_9ASCI|nr:retinoid-inducible serine carboxypeptidase [Phallusia mammillata]